MPSNRRNSRNKNQKDISKIISDNNQELELIKINVDKVKDDVSNISTFAQKQVEIINKSLEKSLKNFEKLQEKATKAYNKMTQEEKKQYDQGIRDIKILNDERERSLKIEEQKTEEMKKQEKRLQYIQRSEKEVALEREKSNYKQDAANSISHGKIGQALSSATKASQVTKRNNLSDSINKLKEDFKNGDVDKATYNKQFEAFTKDIDKLDKSADKFVSGTNALGIAIKGLEKVADLWVQRFKAGMEKIVNTYENTFSKQAVMTGISQREYQNWQNKATKDLMDQGLANNVAISDVMTMTSEFVNSGITNFAKASEMGQTAAIGKILAPHLDQQSDAFISMSQSLGPSFTKGMVGMSKFVSEETGQSRFIQKNMNQIVSMMEPIVMASNKQLMGEEEWSQIESLMKNGYTESEAMALVSEAMDVIRNPSGAIQNGSTLQAMQVANGNYTDVSKYISGKLSDTADLLKGTDGLGRSVAAEEIGAGYKGYLQDDETNYKQARIASKYANEDALRNSNGASTTESENSSYEQLFNDLATDQMQTNSEMKDILSENISTKLATIAEQYPDTYEMLKTIGPSIISGLLSGLTSFLSGKFLSGLWKGAKGIFSGIGKAGKTVAKYAGKAGKGIFKMAGKAVNGAKSFIPKAGSAIKTGVSKVGSALSSPVARVAGGIGGAIMMAKDAYSGVQKADDWFADKNNGGSATVGQKVSSGIGAALGGTGPAIDDKDASIGDKAKSLGSGALKGAAIGTAIGGPVGTLIGGAVGAVGAAIGGERIAKAVNAVGEGIKDAASTVGNFVKDRWNDLKDMGGKVGETLGSMWNTSKEGFMKLGDNAASAFEDFVNFLTTIPEKISKSLQWGIDSFMTSVQNMFAAILNIPIFIGNTIIGVVNGVKNGIKNWAQGLPVVGGSVKDEWFPDDMPQMDYAEMQEMPSFSSYATGTDYIESNGQMAYLHEGEAVLTKPAASILRANTTQDISSLSGLQDAFYSPFNSLEEQNNITASAVGDVSYIINDIKTINRDGFNLIASAIADQTSSLLFKLDQILTTISSGKSSNTQYNSKLVSLSGGID